SAFARAAAAWSAGVGACWACTAADINAANGTIARCLVIFIEWLIFDAANFRHSVFRAILSPKLSPDD
ncbi:hypothetical protein, partial [Burkholderia pseudomallei]|uniref:hypothetical protein n=1 Tax=Burkholderia pseudomallei TaxID=28450 RepID=UPI0015C2D272